SLLSRPPPHRWARRGRHSHRNRSRRGCSIGRSGRRPGRLHDLRPTLARLPGELRPTASTETCGTDSGLAALNTELHPALLGRGDTVATPAPGRRRYGGPEPGPPVTNGTFCPRIERTPRFTRPGGRSGRVDDEREEGRVRPDRPLPPTVARPLPVPARK